MKLAFGMFVFLIFYIIEIVAIGMLTEWYWAVLFAMTLYPAGVFTIHYINATTILREASDTSICSSKRVILLPI